MNPEEAKKQEKKTALQQWLKRKKSQPSTKGKGITPKPEGSPAVLSYGQQRLWFLQKLHPDNPFYHYAHRYHFRGKLQVKHLQQSWQQVIQRHAILQTVFVEVDGQVIQQVKPKMDTPIEVIDLQHLPVEQLESATQKQIETLTKRPFDLQEGPLVRLNVFCWDENEYWVVLTMHHIIGDRWSLGILNREWATAYVALTEGKALEEEENPIQYLDYAHWQRLQKTKPEDLSYWQNRLAGELPLMALPTDFSRPSTTSFRGKMIRKKYSTHLTKQIKTLCQQNSSTPFAFLLAAFKIVLHRYTGQTDLLVGTPFSNRDQTSLEKLIGFFNETLILRSDLSDDPTFLAVVEQVKTATIDAFTHKNVPFEELVRNLKVNRMEGANPLFQVMFLYDKALPTPSFGSRLSLEESAVDLGVSKFDLTLFMVDHGDHLEAVFEYASDLFEQTSIERMHQHLERLLEQVVEQPKEKISNFSLLTPPEKQQLIIGWNKSIAPLPTEANIHQIIEAQATKNPKELAVVYEDDELTYEQLNDQANALANTLVAKGVKKNQAVGIYAKRSVEMVVAILGILKSGAAYLPLDPNYPSERIEYMLEDAKVEIVLAQAHLLEEKSFTVKTVFSISEAVEQGRMENNPTPVVVHRDDLAYIIYTSGSTGKPKGVPINHSNLIHSTTARFHFYEEQPGRFLLLSSFSFDSSIVGLFWSICSGGTLVLPRKRIEQDLDELAALIDRHQVTHTLLLPSLYAVLLAHAPLEKLRSLNTVMVAGEACLPTLVDQHFNGLPEVHLYNEYGPTEGTVWCTAYKIEREDAQRIIPIGRPIPYVENYILDAKQRLVPIGVTGELYVGGAGVAKGYLDRPELTAKKFIPHPFQENANLFLYKTGDLARYRSDGVIDFLGRVDHQVKIRGFRIELDEIKIVLLRQETIQDAVVVVHQEKNPEGNSVAQRLLAYVLEKEKIDPANLLEQLHQQLPSYMVPTAIIPLSEFPRLPNGKINLTAFPAPERSMYASAKNYEAASNPVEQKLVDIWEEVLQIQPIGINDNFFDIGGDSILSIQIIAKARKVQLKIAANQLYNQQSIKTLAKAIENESVETEHSPSLVPEKGNYPLSFMQEAFLMHHLREADDEGLLQLIFTLKGRINIDLFQTAWQLAVQRHAFMRSSIHWRNLESPAQVIHETAAIPWTLYDWQNQSEEEQQASLLALKEKDRNEPLNWSEAPMSRMAFIQLAEDRYQLFWTCHHVLLDGWSGGIVLKDALTFYQAEGSVERANLEQLPSYAAYLAWKNEQDLTAAKTFWTKNLSGYSTPGTFESKTLTSKDKSFKNHTFILDVERSNNLRQLVRGDRITLPTLLQGLWGILLAKYFDTQDVVFGTTVSGRFVNFAGIEQMTGLFMNVLPTRVRLKPENDFPDWLKTWQVEQAQVRHFEHLSLDEINAWINWPAHLDLFDCLFVYGNFLKDGLAIGDIAIENFSGGFTSMYPLTIRVNPIEALVFDLRYDEQCLSKTTIEWFENELLKLLKQVSETNWKVQDLSNSIAPVVREKHREEIGIREKIETKAAIDYLAPRNEVELRLSKIWEELLGRNPIGVRDHFFEIGGRSLLAIQLFTKIEEAFGCSLPAITLFEHPTIEVLAKLVVGNTEAQNWSSLVPLRATGEKAPLFCFHAGGGHVFFYKALAQHFDSDRPIYAVQPKGIDGSEIYHESIEEMANDYLKEIRRIQPNGPYHLLGTCFSNAVGLEVANQLDAVGEEVALLAIVDSGPAHLVPVSPNGERKPLRRFAAMVQKGDWQNISKKLSSRWQRNKKRFEKGTKTEAEQKLESLIESLNDLYRKYTWKRFSGKITFVRSEEFAAREDKEYHLKQWTNLAGAGLDVYVIPGHHQTLFEEPEVEGLVRQLEECLGEEVNGER